MPTVPFSNTPHVARQPLPNPTLSTASSPNAAQMVGQGLMQLGSAQAQAQQQADQIRAQDAKNQLDALDAQLTFDKETGFLQQRGLQALERPSGLPLADEYLQKRQERIEQIAGDLGNDTQRRLFMQYATHRSAPLQAQLLRHEAEQLQVYSLAVHDSTISHKTQEMAQFYTDAQHTNESMQAIEEAVYAQAQLTGKPTSWAQEQTTGLISHAHILALQSALQNDDVNEAAAYLKRYASGMRAEDRFKAQELVYRQVDALQAKHIVHQVMAENEARTTSQNSQEEGVSSPYTLEDLLARVHTRIGDAHPERLQMAENEVIRQYHLHAQAIKQHEDHSVAQAMRWLMENQGRFVDLPIELREAVSPQHMDRLLTFAKKIAAGDETTDAAWYQKLSDPAVLMSLSDDAFFQTKQHLSMADFKHFATQRAQLTSGTASASPGNINMPGLNNRIDLLLGEMHIASHPKPGHAEAARVGAIRRFITHELLQAQHAQGHKFTDIEMEGFVDRLFLRQAQSRGGWFTSSGSAQMLGMKAANIPKDIDRAIRAEFKKRGVAKPTDAQVLEAYWRGVRPHE